MRVGIDDFAHATHRLHARSVKKTRLSLKFRPHSGAGERSKILVLRCTDGVETYTTSVESFAALKQVEALVTDFVTRCTADSAAIASATTTTTTSGAAAAATSNTGVEKHTDPTAAAAGGGAGAQEGKGNQNQKGGNNNNNNNNKKQQQQSGGGGGGKKGGKKGRK